MKKTLLLSVIASVAIMAGGDIAPVETAVVVVVPAQVQEVSAWNFSGTAKTYYQTSDAYGLTDLGDSASSAFTNGVQLNVDGNLGAGFGVGGQLTGLYSNTSWTGLRMSDADGSGDNATAAFTKAYITYGIGNTNIKVGRQELPKSLSPFAFSEKWNVFSNTFQAATIINTDIPNTTLVGAYVDSANNYGDLSEFNDINEDGVYMLTVQNKSIRNLALTGSYYFAEDMNTQGDLSVVWGDAKYDGGAYMIAAQGGYIFNDAVDSAETTAFGAKIGAKFSSVKACLAYSTVDDGALSVQNFGTGIKTPLYTQMILNQNQIASDADAIVGRASVDAFGANFALAYGYTTDNSIVSEDKTELDLTYSRKIGKNTEIFTAYVYSNVDNNLDADTNNMLRFWGKYNF